MASSTDWSKPEGTIKASAKRLGTEKCIENYEDISGYAIVDRYLQEGVSVSYFCGKER